MFFIVIFILLAISVALAIHSLQNLQKLQEVDKVKKNLKDKGKVVFYRDTQGHDSRSSSS